MGLGFRHAGIMTFIQVYLESRSFRFWQGNLVNNLIGLVLVPWNPYG